MAGPPREHDLSSIWLFSACTPGQLRTIGRAFEEQQVPAGRVLCEEGTIGLDFFFILEGTVSVRRGSRTVAALGPGQYFGELSLLDRKPRSATVVSETDLTVLRTDHRHFNNLLDDSPELAHQLLVAMSARLRRADEQAFGS